MSFEIGRSINELSDKFLKIPFVRAVADNPVYSAVLIAIMIVVILAFVYNDDKKMTLMRMGFWSFVVATIVIFLRDRCDVNNAEDYQTKAMAQDIFTTPMVFADENVPVAPIVQ